MNPFPVRILLLAALAALPGARAAGAAPPALTLAEALDRATKNHPALLPRPAVERAAAARTDQAGFRPNPTLGLTLENIAGTGAVRGLRGLEATAELTQVIERGGKRDRRIAVARAAGDVAHAESALLRAEIQRATAAAYLGVVGAEQRLALAREAQALAEESAAAVSARLREGAASTVESARTTAAVTLARAESARAESAVHLARAALAALWGGDAADVPPLGAVLQPDPALPDRDQLLAGLATHPRRAAHAALLAAARAALDTERVAAVSDVEVTGGLRLLRDGSDAALVAGLSLPLPVRHRNQGGILAAREELAATELSLRAVDRELHAEFSSAWSELAIARAAAHQLRTVALPAAAEALATVRVAYTQGELPVLDLFDAQRALTALRRDLLEVDLAAATALVRAESLAAPGFPATAALLVQP